MLFSEPKIPQYDVRPITNLQVSEVSVLFSEPKIPQSITFSGKVALFDRFSALQRAENSSIQRLMPPLRAQRRSFSALQRAENSSMRARNRRNPSRSCVSVLFSEPKIPQFSDGASHTSAACGFQCSSASRKFLNERSVACPPFDIHRFSALQRAENSSIPVDHVVLASRS